MTFCQIGILVHCSWARPEIENKNRCNSYTCAYLALNKRLFFHHLWCTEKIIPVSKWLVAPIYLRDLLTTVINNLLTRMILQVGILWSKISNHSVSIPRHSMYCQFTCIWVVWGCKCMWIYHTLSILGYRFYTSIFLRRFFDTWAFLSQVLILLSIYLII